MADKTFLVIEVLNAEVPLFEALTVNNAPVALSTWNGANVNGTISRVITTTELGYGETEEITHRLPLPETLVSELKIQ